MTSPAHDPADLDGFGTTAMVQCAQEWLLGTISAELFGDEAPSAAGVADWIGKCYPGGVAAFVRQHASPGGQLAEMAILLQRAKTRAEEMSLTQHQFYWSLSSLLSEFARAYHLDPAALRDAEDEARINALALKPDEDSGTPGLSGEAVAKYITDKGDHCPFCEGTDVIATGDEDNCDEPPVRGIECENCGASWEETLQAAGIARVVDEPSIDWPPTCVRCGKPIAPTATLCPECGADQCRPSDDADAEATGDTP